MPKYPAALADWSGNRKGGVKKLFYAGAGQPAGKLITTGLLDRLASWSDAIAEETVGVPTAILLLGGPGNGKTEAIEHALRRLDVSLGTGGALVDRLAESYDTSQGKPPPRLVEIDLGSVSAGKVTGMLAVVQDASESSDDGTISPADLLCQDLLELLEAESGSRIYLACVNRGILDDALIMTLERGEERVAGILKKAIRAASLSASAPQCWPLDGFPWIAIWPMDVETLVESSGDGSSAAEQILEVATDEQDWPAAGTCDAREHCPYCTSRALLAEGVSRSAFKAILRSYELASGKRWNFRDLFSLVAHILAGDRSVGESVDKSPCKRAAQELLAEGVPYQQRDAHRKRGLLRLLKAQYPHSIFSSMPRDQSSFLLAQMRQLGLADFAPLVAFQKFLETDHDSESTTTLRGQLEGISELLDPGLANPSYEVMINAEAAIKYGEIDRRFSLSVKEGLQYTRGLGFLSAIESSSLELLAQIDAKLAEQEVRRQRPAAADEVQGLVRSFAARMVRRAIGGRTGVTRDFDVLSEFREVVAGNSQALHGAAKHVQALLNESDRFTVCLNSTFGEPLPPVDRRVSLVTDIQRVKQLPLDEAGTRPPLPFRYLRVGSEGAARPVALTFDLFKATKLMQSGMVPASLPRSVVALLDTTRASLAGAIVRDEDALDGAEIRLGNRPEVVERTPGRFTVRQGGQ